MRHPRVLSTRRLLLTLSVAGLCALSATACAPGMVPVGRDDPGSADAGSAKATGPAGPHPSKTPHQTPSHPTGPGKSSAPPATSTDARIVLTEPPGQPQRHMDALLTGRFGFVGNTCLSLVMDDGGAFLVRMPDGTRVEKVGGDWRVFTPGGSPAGIVVGDRVSGGGGHLYGADADELDDVPPACRGVGLAQFRIEK